MKPYWKSELAFLDHEKVKIYGKWLIMGRPRNKNNSLYCNYKKIKKLFAYLTREYENEEIIKAVRSAEIDRNSFGNMFRTCRIGSNEKSLGIGRGDGDVVHQLNDVLEVWRNQFSKLATRNRIVLMICIFIE